MPVKPEQKPTLRTHILANAVQLQFGGGLDSISSVFGAQNLNSADAQIIADWYNLTVNPNYYVVRPDAPVVDIRNNIIGARFTPAPAITSGNAQQHMAASNACMGKLALLDFLLPPGISTFDATRSLQTASIKDALTALPSAGAFGNQDAGWVPGNGSGGVANFLVRPCTNAEFVFKTGANLAALNDGVSVKGAWNTVNGLGNPDQSSAYGISLSGNDISDLHGLTG